MYVVRESFPLISPGMKIQLYKDIFKFDSDLFMIYVTRIGTRQSFSGAELFHGTQICYTDAENLHVVDLCTPVSNMQCYC